MKKTRVLALALLLGGCSSTIQHTSPEGLALIAGREYHAPQVSGVHVRCNATLLHQGKKFKFDTWMEADSSHGRIEATGPLGMALATLVWRDSIWDVWLPGQSTLVRGNGSSLNLPVLNLRELQPSRLALPLLGRILPNKMPYRRSTALKGQTVLYPAIGVPTWAVLVDNESGLPIRTQTLRGGKEVEAIAYFDWQKHDSVLIPGRLVRTTLDGQILELTVTGWGTAPTVPPDHLSIRVPSTSDTIIIGQDHSGRKTFRIRSPGDKVDTGSVFLPRGGSNSLWTSDGPAEETDSTTVDDTDEESEDEPETPATTPDEPKQEKAIQEKRKP